MVLAEEQFLKKVKILTLWVIIGQLLTAFVGRSLSPLMIYIGSDLSLNKVQLGLLPTALFIGQFIGTLPIGFLVDKKSVRKVILIIMLVVGGAFFLFSWSNIFIVSFVAIMMAGIGYGGMHPSTNKAIVQMYPNAKVSLPMGLKQMSITLGSSGASLILIPIAILFGWRVALSLAVILLIIFSLLLYRKLAILEELPSTSKSSKSIVSQIGPLVKNKSLLFTTGSAFLLMGIQVTFNTYLIIYLYEIKEWSIYSAGICLAISELGGAAGRVLWGIISDRLFRQNRWVVLILITMQSILLFYLLHIVFSAALIILIVVSIGFSLSGFNGVWMSLAVESVEPEQSGTASGFSVMFASVGVMIIPPIFGFFVDLSGYVAAGSFIIISLTLCFVILVLANFITNRKRNVESL
ncbi:sugar phosphate permease [Ureibacillus acetophenoni]|uniref:Sugar phosphate permease n=1 Tax=Ureibacillus acetophenoni TaxID=614649 RepID=A0A285UE71_9BACL|nr:sugar phosphate permease [Ureibacillus acetophenoni]